MASGNSSASSGGSSVAIKRKTRNAGTSVKLRDSSEARESREQLLGESTSADDLLGVTASNEKKIKMTGKRKKRKIDPEIIETPSRTMPRTLGIFVLIVSLAAAISTTILFFEVKGQTTSLRYQIEKVSAGMRDLPQQIQNCRSVSRQLTKDLDDLSNQMTSIAQKFNNLTVQTDQSQKALFDVQSKLHSYPELISIPKQLDELSNNVANLGGQLQDVQLKINQLFKDKSTQISELLSAKANLSALHVSLNNLKNEISLGKNKDKDHDEEKIFKRVEAQLNNELNALNQSLSTRLNWTSTDQQNDHKTIDALQEKYANLSAQFLTFADKLTRLTSNVSSWYNQFPTLKSAITEKTLPSTTRQESTATVQSKKATDVIPVD